MLIGLSGLKGSGKNTVADYLTKQYSFTQLSFADPVREMALTINPWVVHQGGYGTIPLTELINDAGWDWAKNNVPEVRRLLQRIGTEAGRNILGENVWVDNLANRVPDIAKPESRYVITDCRFPNEATFIDSQGGSIIWVDRPGLVSDGHISESVEMRKWRNWLVINDASFEQLYDQVFQIMISEGVEPIE